MYEDVVLMDGGVGTSLWEKVENEKEKVMVWRYNIEKPDIVKKLHKELTDAGSQIILANTFGANHKNMRKTNYNVTRIVTEAMKLAHEAIGDNAKIALAVGPLTGLLEPYGNISGEDAYDSFNEQISAGVAGKPDLIYCQTFMDVTMMQIAAKVARQYDLPFFCSFSFEENGRTLMGNSVKDIVDGMAEFHPDAIGLNCSFGPDLAVPIIKEFSETTDLLLIFKPNAGKPTVDDDGNVQTGFDIETFTDDVMKGLQYGVKYIGGCCGSNAAYIRRLGEKLKAAQTK